MTDFLVSNLLCFHPNDLCRAHVGASLLLWLLFTDFLSYQIDSILLLAEQH